MDEDPIGTPEARESPFDRLVRRLERARSLPVPDRGTPAFALGSPGPVIQNPGDDGAVPATDVLVTPARIYVTLEVPGASRETTEIEAEADLLRVSVRNPDGRTIRARVSLPEPIDPAAIEATYRNGVLDIAIPRRRPADSGVRGGGLDGG